jgi:hypothetical protein
VGVGVGGLVVHGSTVIPGHTVPYIKCYTTWQTTHDYEYHTHQLKYNGQLDLYRVVIC